MFDKFGEFNSFHEINKSAEGLKEEGDIASLKELAKENGIDIEDVNDYVAGKMAYLTTELTAAVGKLEVEKMDFKHEFIFVDWFNYIMTCVSDPKNERMRTAVRLKGKSIKGCYGHILKWSEKNMKAVDPDIKKAAGFNGNVKMGIPDMNKAKALIKEYYLGGKE